MTPKLIWRWGVLPPGLVIIFSFTASAIARAFNWDPPPLPEKSRKNWCPKTCVFHYCSSCRNDSKCDLAMGRASDRSRHHIFFRTSWRNSTLQFGFPRRKNSLNKNCPETYVFHYCPSCRNDSKCDLAMGCASGRSPHHISMNEKKQTYRHASGHKPTHKRTNRQTDRHSLCLQLFYRYVFD